jgi:16S rRNA (uracil1498-N3)-methyltransferase
MRLTRVHVAMPLATGAMVALPEGPATHLARVLRLREGDACVLFNGDGHDHDAVIRTIGKRGVEVELVGARAVDNASPLALTLLQGIARGEKMDLILQKSTELGVTGIVPVFAERTEVRLDGERLAKRTAHWLSVVASACEQSGRTRLPALDDARALEDAVARLPAGGLRLVLDPQGTHRFASLAAPEGPVVVAIGPEGGWSPRDREVLHGAGFEGLRLGPRVLRTETAGLAAIAALQARFGDF